SIVTNVNVRDTSGHVLCEPLFEAQREVLTLDELQQGVIAAAAHLSDSKFVHTVQDRRLGPADLSDHPGDRLLEGQAAALGPFEERVCGAGELYDLSDGDRVGRLRRPSGSWHSQPGGRDRSNQPSYHQLLQDGRHGRIPPLSIRCRASLATSQLVPAPAAALSVASVHGPSRHSP